MSKKKINLKRGAAEKLSSTSVSKDNSKKSTTTTKTENTTKKDPMENFVGAKRQTKKVNVTSEPTVNPFKGYTGKSAKSQREDFAKAAETIRKDFNIIPSLSMVDESTTASTGNRTTGSIASMAKKGSTRKIEKEVVQNYSNGSYESTNDRIRRNSNEKLIDEYESIPSYGLGERIVDRDKKQAYDKKQTMYGDYKKALKENYGKALSDLGFTEDDLYAAFYPGYGEEVARQQGRKQYEDMQRYSPQAAEEFRAAYDTAVKGEQITSQLRQKIADAGLNVDRTKEYFDVWKQEQDEQATFERGKNDKAGTFVASAIGKPVENIFGTVDYALDYLSGRPIDSQFKEADTMRSGAQSDMSTIPSLLYGAGSSIADILTGLAIGGGAYSAVNQGLAQANSVIDSASERGLTPNKIMAEGIGSGAATAITEMGALGRMQDLIKDAGKSFLAKLGGGAAAEGLQEVFESLINTGIDITLGGKNSELAQDYVSQLKSGVDKETALVNTGKNYAVSLLYDFLGGAIAGGVLTGGGNIINNAINGQNNASENVIPGLEAKAVEQSTDNVIQNAIDQQTAAQTIEQLAQQIPEVQPEVQGESAPIPNEPTTIKIAPVEAPADYAFTLPEIQAEAINAQVEQRSEEISNIVGSDNFGAMEFTTDNGSRYIASKSTRDGVEYQLSLIDANGDPVSHSEYQSPVELAEAVNDLTWNKNYEYHVLNNQATEQLANDVKSVENTPEVSEQATEAEEPITSNEDYYRQWAADGLLGPNVTPENVTKQDVINANMYDETMARQDLAAAIADAGYDFFGGEVNDNYDSRNSLFELDTDWDISHQFLAHGEFSPEAFAQALDEAIKTGDPNTTVESIVRRAYEIDGKIPNENLIGGTGNTQYMAPTIGRFLDRIKNNAALPGSRQYKEYTGKKPKQDGVEITTYSVTDQAYNTAKNILNEAAQNAEKPGDYKNSLQEIYKNRYDNGDIPNQVTVKGTTFDGKNYVVQINKASIKKLLHDTALSPEKLAVLENIGDILGNSEFYGSGEYDQHASAKKNNVERYDYFRRPVSINGKLYDVVFNIESYKGGTNNYRTHKINEMSLVDSGLPARLSGATRQLGSFVNSNVANYEENVNSEPVYLGAVENSPYALTPEQQTDFDEYGTFSPDVEETTAEPIDENEPWIVDGQVTRNGENQIRNGKEPKLKSVTDPRYNGQWLGIRQTLTNYDLGKESGARQFSWQIANEINAYLEDGDTQHLENAQTYANYIDNVINPYMQGKTYEHRGRGGKKVTVEEGTQNISGRVRDLINSIVADEKGAILETAPENVQTAIQNIENIKELGTIMLPGDIDRFVGNYKTLLNKLAEGEPVTDAEFTALTNAATEINNNLLQTEQSLTDSTLPEEFTSEYFIENYLEAQNYLDALSREVTGRDIEVNIPSVEPTVEAPAEEIPAFEEEKPRREMAMEANRGTSTNNDNDTDFAEITIDPETGEEDYERGPEDRPEVGENWGKRYRGAVYDEEGNMKVSQAARNTLYDAPSVQENPELQEKMLEYEDEGRFGAEVSHNAESAEKAQEIVDNSDDIKKTLEDILSENMTFDEMNTVQQDTLMKGVDRMLNEAAESGDFTGVAEILEQTVSRQHKIGQLLQALAKYTHTAASAVTKATTMIHDATDNYVQHHKKQAAINGKLAQALETMGNKYADRTAPKREISHEEMLKRVRNTLEQEFASVSDRFNDSAINQITALVESDIPMWQLRDELEHFLNRGEFYTIDESTEQKQAKSQKLANVLREVTEGKQERVVNEKTIAQIKQEVRTLINTEYYSISDEFDDDDIDFLANRIYNGAESQELVDALNQKLATGSLGYTEEELAEVVQLYNEVNSGLLTSREEYEAMNKANAILAKHLGHGTLMDRLNQWRYLAMLSAPSTHLKNIDSTGAWSMVTMFKDTLAASMEAVAEAAGADIERTKSVILPTAKDRALVKEAYKSFDRDVYADYARGGSKYNDRNEIRQQQKVGSKLVSKLSDINSGLLEKEDIFFGRAKYTQALAGYLKANKADASIFSSTDPDDRALVKKAEEYALAEANKATFHEENKVAQTLTQLSRSTAEGGMMGVNAVVEGLVPFKKTTANIAKQFTAEYNPAVQLPKAIYQTIQHNGNVAETIDSYAKGLTGAGLITLGAYLASQGMLVATGDKDDKDDVLGQAEDFAITWFDKDGDQHYYTVDGIAPTAMLMFVGAELYESGFSLDSLTGITDSFIENSLLSGLNNMVEEISYSNYDKDKSKLFTLAANMANNYVSQYIPTLSGKFARSIDKTRRSTYTGKKGDMDTLYRYGKKIMNKIPGLSMLNEPYIDAYGNEVENVGGNFAGRLLYNLTSIGYYSERERDDIQKTIESLDEYAQTLEGDARDEMEKQLTDLITAPDKSYNGERLSPEQYTEYSKATGKAVLDVFNGLIGNDIFQAMTPEDQAAVMDQMGLFAKNLAKREVFGETSKTYEKLMDMYDDKDMDGVMEYLTIKSALDGDTSSAAAVAAVELSDMSIEDKSYYLSKFITQPSKDAQKAIDALGDNGLYYWYSTMAGKTKKEDQYQAILDSGYSDKIKSELTKIVYNSGKDTATPTNEIPSLESLTSGYELDTKGEAIRKDKGDDYANQYYEAKDYIQSSADSLGVSTSSTSAEIAGLNELDTDDATKGYYLQQLKGDVSKKALAASAELGDAGIYYWYSVFVDAQQKYDKRSPKKSEIQEVIDSSDYPDDVKAALTKANKTK